ncbi:hypothetical protein A3A09_00410 [Candidatus Nomurabacteria bacterium RIFCSPLOWO2_01_FULL_42_20]|nr:MAG: hypothetical protein A3A09_00410 [Candidatus Nomurabacteria bacterium RIFCSPLOWO2_01_FULL_42_20]
MKITYDKIADAMYIYLNKAKVAKTIKMADKLLVDLDRSGKVLGIEVLDASSQIKQKKPAELRIRIPAFS